MALNDLTGKVFGRLSVLYRDNDSVTKSGRRHARWMCRCECGKLTSVNADALTSGRTVSCGCFRNELLSKRQKTHGDTSTRLYGVWSSMKSRCLNSSNAHYGEYGGRGITVCDEWKESYESFKSWAVESGYELGKSIDRIDVNGNYEPENCRWVTSVAQANNRRSNRMFTFNGETHNLTEWSALFGINPKTLFNRIYSGWSFERAITTINN